LREREFELKKLLVQKIFKLTKWPNEWRGRRPPFIGPIGNLPVGKGYWNPIIAPDMSSAWT
jgi:hypothetical protein